MGFVKMKDDASTDLAIWQIVDALSETLSVPTTAVYYGQASGLPSAVNKALEKRYIIVAIDVPGVGFFGIPPAKKWLRAGIRGILRPTNLSTSLLPYFIG